MMSEAGILPQSPNAKYGMIPDPISDSKSSIIPENQTITRGQKINSNQLFNGPYRGSQGDDPVLLRTVSQASVPLHVVGLWSPKSVSLDRVLMDQCGTLFP